ncbi:MAG: phage major capsid protein [Coriobacteriia bacterium]|nr:phage major capsid protein [Coriobacteriia bacterium]
MSDFNNIIGRPDVAGALMPDQTISGIIQELPKSSVLMERAKKVRLSAKKAKQAVLTTLPEAFWLDGDTGLKKTTKADWKDQWITAEELAVIVPVPNAVIDDASIDIWQEIKPLLAEAIGLKLDVAALFGVDKPTSWPEAIIPAAAAAGNVVTSGTVKDLGVDVAALGKMIAKQGFGINGFASMPGLQWELIGLRNEQGTPIYTPSLSAGTPSGLYGYALNEVLNGSWDSDRAELLAIDWSKFLVGIRQDVTYDIFSEGVISDSDGKVVLNLMQQDSKAVRVVMRVGFASAVPVTRIGEGQKYPAGIIAPAGATFDTEDTESGEEEPVG